jgi:hypothetical protein
MASREAEQWWQEKGRDSTAPTEMDATIDAFDAGYERGAAALREVMKCGHPKACLKSVASEYESHEVPGKGVSYGPKCLACVEKAEAERRGFAAEGRKEHA